VSSPKRLLRAFALVATGAIALTLSACGSSDSGSSTTTAAATTAATTAAASSESSAGSETAGSDTAAASDTGSASETASGGGSSNLPKTVVFSPLSLQPPALKGLAEGIQAYAPSKGWDVIVQDPNFDATKQQQQLTEVLDSGRAGAAWIIAVAPQSMGDILTSAQGKGVPVLVNGKPAEWGFDGPQPGISFDYIDYTAGGTALGDQLGKCITQKLNGTAEVFFAVSTPGQAGKDEFEAAATKALKAAAPNANVVQNIVVADRAKGQTDIGNALQGHPKVTAVMASTDEGALGAIGAFDAAGKDLPCVTDFGGNDEVLAAVKAGTIFASVALQFQADMTQSFDTLVAMQADPKKEGPVLTVPQKVVTQNG
jgi:ABC-type sugar transport system substrate-binding protein